MTVVVASNNLLGIDWTAVAAIAATLGGIAALDQLRRLRNEGRAAHFPVLSARSARIDLDGRFILVIDNHGTGPALNVTLRVWSTPTSGYLRGKELVEAGDEFWPTAKSGAPKFETILAGINNWGPPSVHYVGRDKALAESGGWALLAVAFEHEDIFGRKLPRTPKEKRRPGYLNLIPTWDKEFSGRPIGR